MIKGKALMLQVSSDSGTTYNTIAMATSCSCSLSSSLSDVSTKDDNDKYQYQEVTGQNWELTTENLIPSDTTDIPVTYDTLLTLMENGTELLVTFAYLSGSLGTSTSTGTWTGVTTAEIVFSGSAVITSLDMNFANKENATMSATFSGKGVLTVAS